MTRFALARPALLIATAALAACSAPEDQPLPGEPGTAITEVAPTATPVTTTTTTATGGDGSPLALAPLTGDDLSGVTLEGELGCSFSQDAGGPSLLVARGDVADADERASFAVKIGGHVQQGLALENGGYDALLDGSRFGTQGFVLIVRDVGAPQGGGESPPRGAELFAQRADGAERVLAGLWTCGP